MEKDKCILCGQDSPYEFETHIDYRVGYVEGSGQLCVDCYLSEDKKQPEIYDNIENKLKNK